MKTQNVSQKHMAYNITHLATAPSENTFIIKFFSVGFLFGLAFDNWTSEAYYSELSQLS